MGRVSSKPEDVFLALVDRLRDQVDGANDSTCYLSLNPDYISSANSGDFVYVVSPAPSFRFDPGLFDGGRQEQAQVTWQVVFTIHSTYDLDEAGHDEEFVGNAKSGVFPPVTNVARAILGYDPVNADDDWILAEPIFPSDGAIQRPTRSQGSVQLGVSVVFNWDLSDPS